MPDMKVYKNKKDEEVTTITTTPTKETPFSDYDLNVAKQRVYNILKTSVENNELVACLPILIRKNGKVLKVLAVEKKEHVDFIKEVCLRYYDNKRRRSSGTKGEIPKKRSASQKRKKDTKENTDSQSIVVSQKDQNKSQRYTKVKPLFSAAVGQFLKLKCVNLRKRDIINKYGLPGNAFKFISCLEILTDIAAELLFQSDKEVKEKGEELTKAARNSKLLEEIINDLLVKVDNLKTKSSKQLAEKEVDLEKLQCKKDLVDVDYRNRIKGTWISNMYEMVEAKLESAERLEELKDKVKTMTEVYTTLCNKNLSTEKKLKNKCSKVESQLASWLAKYDSDVGDKRMEYEKLQDELDEVDSAIENFQNMLDDLDPDYLRFKEEEEAELQEKFNEMAYKFLLNRSAMTIQRYWRAYRLEKKAKKKGKGGKKGKSKK